MPNRAPAFALTPERQPLPAPGAWQWLTRSGDVDAQAQAQPGWRLEYQQLSGGRFSGLLHQVQLPGLRLVREDADQALRQRGDIGRGAYGFAMALEMSGAAIFNGQRVERDAIMLGRSDELDLVTPTRFSLIGVVVEAALLNPLWERMYQKPLAAWLEAQRVVAARPAAAHNLRRLQLQALRDLADPDTPLNHETALLPLRDALLMEWIEALPERVDACERPSLAARKQLVDRACALMLAHRDQPLSMLDVCSHVGASRRKLNYCFQEVLGASPVKHLRAVRLNGVRRELRRGAAGVHEVAARWGFWHLGQFARHYREQFGELPSVTLKARETPPTVA